MKKRALSLALALASCLAMIAPAFADASTTGGNTAYLSLDPKTEIYAATSTPGTDYPYYGAKYEPKKGVFYGRTCNINDRGDGKWVVLNESQMAEESIFSYYFDWNVGHSLSTCNVYFDPLIKDNARALLIYFNFYGEVNDFAPITAGQHDSQIRDMFTYLSKLTCPVFLRIGGEMNIWGSQAAPAAGFIDAYRHIADIGRSIAPNVALVFSPNYGSHTGTDMDSYYPGDAYVDWVGVSLYYDRFSTTGDTAHDAFYGVNTYGDALLNVQRVISLARMHNKPVMATEGGSANSFNGQDISAWAADRMARALAFLPMVYPEIKAVVSSDYHFAWEASSYEFFTNPTVTAAYRQAVSTNPTYLKSNKDTNASYYTKLSAYTGAWEGTMHLAAYSWASDKLSATWSVDGQQRATATEYPYAFELDTSALSTGSHSVTVTFSNGATKSYSFQTTAPAIQASNGAQVDDWAKDQVNEAISKDLVADKLGNDYRGNITRAQFAATAVKLYEAMSGKKAETVTQNPFTDTNDPVVLQAADLGFVYGITDTTFAPNDLVTREQAAAMLSRVYTKLGNEIPTVSATSFADNASVSDWARDAVAFMSDKGVISGVGGNQFAPKGNATIQQALSIALRMHNNLK